MRHLELLNAFLALRFRQNGYPPCLEEAEFLVNAIGVTMKLEDGTSIAPDVVASQLERRLTLLVEVKSGAQLVGDQLRRMLDATPQDLRDFGHLPIDDTERHRVHVVYVCNEADRHVLAEDITDERAAVVGFDGQRFRITGELPHPDLSQCLRDAEIAAGAHPLAIVPFDGESSDGEIAQVVLPHVVDAWLQGRGHVAPETLVRQTHHHVFDLMGSTGSGSERRQTVQRVKQVLSELARQELSEWLERSSSSPIAWRFRKSSPASSNRTRELQKLQRAVHAYLERLGTPMQLELFDGEDEVSDS